MQFMEHENFILEEHQVARERYCGECGELREDCECYCDECGELREDCECSSEDDN